VLSIDPVTAPPRRSQWSRVRGSAGFRRAQRWARVLVRRVRNGPGRWVRRGWVLGRQTWRRSLQFRIVSITLVLSGLLIAAFGLLVTQLITDGQLELKVNRTSEQVNAGGQYAVSQLRVDGP
jgi:hypothetical protein